MKTIVYALIFFSSHLFAADSITTSLDTYLKAGGYSDEDITQLFRGVAEKRITMEEIMYRGQLALVGYPLDMANTIIEKKITLKELEYRFILQELGYTQDVIEVIIETVRILKGDNNRSSLGKIPPPFITGSLEKRVQEMYPFVKEASLTHDVNISLILAVIHQESRFVAKAISSEGAGGLMQLMPGTARDLGVRNVFDPKQNIMGGTKYLRQLMDSFEGDLDLVLAAYNSGPERVRRIGRIPRIPETVDYVIKVKQYLIQYEQKYAKL